jgi:photosystem II stability/assembly factor-like uncharacterized protein
MGSLPVNTLVRSVAVDPLNPKRVYIAGPAGLFRSDDGGLTWKPASDGLKGEPMAVTLKPASPQTVIAVLTDGSVWQSLDGATTWKAVKASQ